MTSEGGVKAHFHAESKLAEGTIETIAAAAEKCRADLLLVGAYGLKIEQGETHGDTFSVMGSVSNGSLRRSDVSVGVVKSTSYELEPGEGRKFMVATDDSPSAKVAFALLVTKLAKKQDKIFVYANVEGGEAVLAKYKVECDKLGLECEIHAETVSPAAAVSEAGVHSRICTA